jgi:hypothetical protein
MPMSRPCSSTSGTITVDSQSGTSPGPWKRNSTAWETLSVATRSNRAFASGRSSASMCSSRKPGARTSASLKPSMRSTLGDT